MGKNSLFKIYKDAINPKNCKFCEQALVEDRKKKPKTKKVGPLSYWHMGEKPTEIVFVGKNTWVSKKQETYYKLVNGKFRDVTSEDVFSRDDNRYFNFIRDIVDKTSSRGSVCVTNLAKCKVTDDDDSYFDLTANKYYGNCIAKVFSEEIAGLNPRYVVLFTNMYFNEYLDKLLFGRKSCEDIGKRRTITVKRGKENRTYPWWVRKYKNGNKEMYMLVTRHPQGAWRKELKSEIVKWTRNPERIHY